MSPKSFAFSLALLAVSLDSSMAVLIDDFEVDDFEIVSPSTGPGPSVHSSANSLHVIGGDRDVWTLAHDGPGSVARLAVTSFDDGVFVNSNSVGSIYWTMFQYDGLGRNAFDLNADLTPEYHNAFFINVSYASLSFPAGIQMALVSNWGNSSEAVANVSLPLHSNGIVSVPFYLFSRDNESIDFNDVDSIALIVKLKKKSAVTISDIRTGAIPEPSTLLLTKLGVLMIFPGLRRSKIRNPNL